MFKKERKKKVLYHKRVKDVRTSIGLCPHKRRRILRPLVVVAFGVLPTCVKKSTRVIASPLGSNSPKVFSSIPLSCSTRISLYSLSPCVRIIQPRGFRQMRFRDTNNNIIVKMVTSFSTKFLISCRKREKKNLVVAMTTPPSLFSDLNFPPFFLSFCYLTNKNMTCPAPAE